MQRVIKNRYRVYGNIGTGGMATVYLALDTQTGKAVAVKIMDKKLLSDTHYIERFKREISIASTLNHPNIPRLIDSGYMKLEELGDEGETEVPFIIMEYIQGITLRKYLKQKGRLSIKEATDISIQILDALSYAYSKGIQAHENIKPENIMIETNTKKIKVMDFGIAKTVSSHLTHSTVLYTPGYVSPEQLMPTKYNKIVDKRSDIYSVGVVLYEMLTGEVPFKGETPTEITVNALTQQPIPLIDINRDIPKEINNIVLKCLEKDPNKRYQSPEELIEDLKQSISETYEMDDESTKTTISDRTEQSSKESKTVLSNDNEEGFAEATENCLKLFDAKHYKEAIECFDEAIEIDPKDKEAWKWKRRTLYILGRNKKI